LSENFLKQPDPRTLEGRQVGLDLEEQELPKRLVPKSFLAGFGVVLFLILSVGWLSNRSTRQFIDNNRDISHSHELLEKLADIFSLMKDVEALEHGFVITGNERYLETYETTKLETGLALQGLQSLAAGDPLQREKLEIVRRLVTQRILFSKQVIDSRRNKGFEAVANAQGSDRGKKVMDSLRKAVAELETGETARLKERMKQAEAGAGHTMLLFSILSFLVLTFTILVFAVLHYHFTGRKRAEQLLQQANQELTVWVNELEHSKHEIILLNEMSDLLQSCFTLQEAGSIITQHAQQLFPFDSGAFFLVGESKKMLEAVAAWGDKPIGQRLFQPADCWAFRQGQTYQAGSVVSEIRCSHLDSYSSTPYICIPILGQGEILGLMHLQSGTPTASTDPKPVEPSDSRLDSSQKSRYRLAVTVAKQVGLALANLKLLETLRNQATRDSLTGLFNRRLLAESLEREILRAERSRSFVGIIMIDIDHFKRFNDTFGHAAGDTVLQQLASLLQEQTRGGDLACRYGGEEFALVLPEASLEGALQRAEQLRREVRHLNLYQGQQSLGVITLSLGVAVFPEHGGTVETLLGAADEALYRAKAAGRDRVAAAAAPKQPVEQRSAIRGTTKARRARTVV
jgi:diguanylate cyclase (GGDEF)-like protein